MRSDPASTLARAAAFILMVVALLAAPVVSPAAEPSGAGPGEQRFEDLGGEDDWLDEDDDWLDVADSGVIEVSDPLEPLNRAFFHFNDKLYFWVMKPVATGYAFVLPKPARQCVSNFFHNLGMPARFVNSLLQGKLRGSGNELARFAVNTTVGVAGLWDPARNWLDIPPSEEDLGQTLGRVGIGEGVYICWPFLGPSNLRDSVGMAGDYFLSPTAHLSMNDEAGAAWALKGTDTVNATSLRIGDYEDFKRATFDPYSALRDAYFQNRRSSVRDENKITD